MQTLYKSESNVVAVKFGHNNYAIDNPFQNLADLEHIDDEIVDAMKAVITDYEANK